MKKWSWILVVTGFALWQTPTNILADTNQQAATANAASSSAVATSTTKQTSSRVSTSSSAISTSSASSSSKASSQASSVSQPVITYRPLSGYYYTKQSVAGFDTPLAAKRLTTLRANTRVIVLKQATSKKGTFVQIRLTNGTRVWLAQKYLAKDVVLRTQNKKYAQVVTHTSTLTNTPFTGAAKNKGSIRAGQYVHVMQIATTHWGTYAKLVQKGRFIGWVATTKLRNAVTSNKALVHNMVQLPKTTKIYAAPYTPEVRTIKNTHGGQSVKVIRLAKTYWGNYFQLQYRGKVIGWVKQSSVRNLSTFLLPYTYSSQLNQGAPEGCEGASLQMALSVQGKLTSLKTVYRATGYGSKYTPTTGFYGNPWGHGTWATQTVFASRLAKAVSQKIYARTYDLTNKGKNAVINEIKRGNAVITYGDYYWQVGRAFHVMTIVGYKKGAFLIADPYAYGKRTYWLSTSTWEHVQTHNKYVNKYGMWRSTPKYMNVVVR